MASPLRASVPVPAAAHYWWSNMTSPPAQPADPPASSTAGCGIWSTVRSEWSAKACGHAGACCGSGHIWFILSTSCSP